MSSRKRKEHLYYLYDNRARVFHEIRHGTVCGRIEGDQIYPGDALVSRKHCRFEIEGNEVYIQDIGSTNSTRVNTVPIASQRKRRIRLNDVIEIGKQRLILTNQNLHPPANTEDCPKGVSGIIAIQRDDGSLTRYIPNELSRTFTKRTLMLLDRTTFRRLRAERRKSKIRARNAQADSKTGVPKSHQTGTVSGPNRSSLAKQKTSSLSHVLVLSLFFLVLALGAYAWQDQADFPYLRPGVQSFLCRKLPFEFTCQKMGKDGLARARREPRERLEW